MIAESVLMWCAVTLYAVGAAAFIVAFAFDSTRIAAAATWVSLAGLAPHTAAIAVRWVRVGHLPYFGFYEVVSAYAFVSVVTLGLLVWRRRSLALLGVGVMPVAFLLIGAAMLAPKGATDVPSSLVSWWLTIHVAFAKLCYSSFIAAFGLAVLYLMRSDDRSGRWAGLLSKLPHREALDDLSFRFIGAGFMFTSVMIVAGAIWANEAWGRYWNWDPIETWSLVVWLIYALYLHLRLTMRWRGRKAAWFAVAALPLTIFAFMLVPLVYSSIHGAYVTGVEITR